VPTVNMLDIASNSRPPTTDTTGAASASINNQVSITAHLCPTDEPHELLSPQPIPSQPLPKPNCSTRVGVFVLSTVTTRQTSSPSRARDRW
jgi:hypothetical protein